MKSLIKFAILTLGFCYSVFASANTVEAELRNCVAAVKATTKSDLFYEPSAVAQATKVSSNEEVRKLEAPMCVRMHVVGGMKVVALAAGSPVVFEKGTNKAVRHAKCNNAITHSMYVGAHSPSADAPGNLLQCTECGDVVAKTVTHTTTVIERVVVVQQCIINGKEVTLVGGKCVAPTVAVEAPVVINNPVSSSGGCGATSTCVQKPTFQKQSEAPAKVCAIAIQKSLTDKTIVGFLQLDKSTSQPGNLRIARVASLEGVALQVETTSLKHGTDCDKDQAQVYQHLPAILQKFGFDQQCIPSKVRT
jgi:hypothetical protein